MNEREVKRGQIYMAILDPLFGREIGGFKARPVLVLSGYDVLGDTRMVTIVPGSTTRPGKKFAHIVEVRHSPQNRLYREFSDSTYFQCHQIRSIDQARLMPLGGSFGILAKGELEKIENGMVYTLGHFPHKDIEKLRKLLEKG